MLRVGNSYAAFSPKAEEGASRGIADEKPCAALETQGHVTTILSPVHDKVERAGDSVLPFDRVEPAARTNQLCRMGYWRLRDRGYAAREERVELGQEVLHISDTPRVRRRAGYTAMLNRPECRIRLGGLSEDDGRDDHGDPDMIATRLDTNYTRVTPHVNRRRLLHRSERERKVDQ